MFDNNMNNNQNFNNINSLFSNNLDTGTSSDIYNQGMFSNQNVDYNPQLSGQDVPPELGEIKNLNEATVASAPTLDVLAPMNIMPETLPESKDPLDDYESGKLDIPNFNNNVFPGQSINNMDPFQENGFTMPSSNNTSDTLPNLNDYNTPDFGMKPPINEVGISSDMVLNNGFEKQEIINNETPANEGFLNDNLNTNFNSELNNINIGSFNTSIESNSIPNIEEPPLPPLDTQESSFNDIKLPEIENEKEETGLEEVAENNQDLELNNDLTDEPETSEEADNLIDLGLDESYAETDMLEIMDLDSDEEETIESNSEEELTEDKDLVSTSVEKIKNLVQELKDNGADIELDEFDFESMYQLIVKLNK